MAVAFERLRALGANTALPVLLWLRDQKISDHLDSADYRRAIIDVESYLVRRVAVGANTRGYGTTFREVLIAAKTDGRSAADGVRTALAGLEGSAAWPTDHEVQTAFESRRYYDNVAQYVIRLLLGGVEEQMRADDRHTERLTIDYEELSIEHLLPKTWVTHWPVEGEGADRVLAEQHRDAHVDRIGNLTLIDPGFNSSQSNKPWTEKRPALSSTSALRMNQALGADDGWAVWDEDAITDRARRLSNVAIRIWPRPTTVPEADAPG